jgi:hypothetical protein
MRRNKFERYIFQTGFCVFRACRPEDQRSRHGAYSQEHPTEALKKGMVIKMYCKTIKNKKYWYLLLLAGAVSLAFGILGIAGDSEMEGNGAMLMGMFTGMGAALVGVSAFRLLYMRFAPAERLRKEEISLKDERNIQVTRASYAVSNTAAMVMLAVMAFVFVSLGYRVPAYIAAGAIWVQVVVFLITHRILDKKM